jgi:proline dehydrogenase
VSEGKTLNQDEQAEWQRLVDRYDRICQAAADCDVVLLIDAEESWMQKAADDLCEMMMEKYNKEKPVVFSTLQCYRWDRLDYLKEAHKRAKSKGFKLGYKIVRGAYMEKENERALEKGYKTPICSSKQQTDELFNDVSRYIMDNLEDIHLFLGTHNEDSSYLVMNLLEQKGLAHNDPRVWFGQLYGMSDHITYNMADKRYNIAKYVPFGPVKDVMPYLIRRAEENTSVAGQTSRELSLLKREKERRKL